MECAEVKSRLVALKGLHLRSEPLTAHLHQCPQCQSFAEDLKLRRLLRSMPLRETDADFEQRVLKRAVSAKADTSSISSIASANSRNGAYLGWLAVAASLVVAVLVSLQWQSVHKADEALDLATVPWPVQTQQLEPVQVLLNTERALQGVTVTVDLPEHLALEGYGNKQRLKWTSNLNAGANKLVLPVQFREDLMNTTGTSDAAFDEIVIQLEHEGLRKQFRVPVRQTLRSSASHQVIYTG